MMGRPRFQVASGAIALAALVVALVLPESSPSRAAAVQSCGLTTLQATITTRPDGTLQCGPGDPLVVRDDLATPKPARAGTRDALAAFLSLADLQLTDEESPLRTEWADACGESSTAGSFRPHETLLAQMVNAHVKAASALASTGSPALRAPYSFAVQLGDAADNRQRNEVRSFIDLLDGGKLVDPDSGDEGYAGVQGADPQGGSPALTSPVAGTGIRDLANEPFWAHGLRTASGAPVPWYSVVGTHDIKVQGTIPDDNQAWTTFARAWATGTLKIGALGPDHLQRVCDDPSVLTTPTFWTSVATSPGAAALVAADEARELLDREGWIKEHFTTSGLPSGHGFAPQNRCRDAGNKALSRACYSWDQGSLHLIALDTSPADGLAAGNIDAGQFAWLERELKASSSRYFAADGKAVKTATPDRLIVIFSHHTTTTTTNEPAAPGSTARTGADLEALLLRFPNVILHANGHTHANRVWAHAGEHGGYWEVNTASVADWPTQSRSIEIADNHDGTLSIFAVVYDAAVPPNARAFSWSNDDATDDVRLGGAARRINEDWLASFGREVAFNDPQRAAGAQGAAKDRNVELVLKHPLGVTTSGTFVPPPFRPPTIPTFPTPAFPGLPDNFFEGLQPGFPGLPGQTVTPTTPGFQTPFMPPHTTTTRGLGAPSTQGTGWELRATLLLLAAIMGALWLFQARVRRYMVGI